MRTLMMLVVLLCGAGLAAQGQEIDIERNGSSVPDGGSVDLGSVDVLETTQVDFTIQNEGSTDLTITGGVAVTDTDNCSATVQQPGMTTIPPGQSTTFQVHITNNGQGTFSCDIAVPSDDLDEADYNFQISGTAVLDDTDDGDDDDDDCSTGTGNGGFLMLGALTAIGALLYRRRRRAA